MRRFPSTGKRRPKPKLLTEATRFIFWARRKFLFGPSYSHTKSLLPAQLTDALRGPRPFSTPPFLSLSKRFSVFQPNCYQCALPQPPGTRKPAVSAYSTIFLTFSYTIAKIEKCEPLLQHYNIPTAFLQHYSRYRCGLQGFSRQSGPMKTTHFCNKLCNFESENCIKKHMKYNFC